MVMAVSGYRFRSRPLMDTAAKKGDRPLSEPIPCHH
jgi:hypothetical protein